MTGTDMGGVVLAAGASTRMGRPKALLQTPRGIFLAVHQANLLAAAGCTKVVIVVGEQAVADALNDERTVVHPGWTHGRVSSLQAGLRRLGPCRDGVLVLPVDTVGISPHVLHQLTRPTEAQAVRPVAGGERGQAVRLSAATAGQVLALPANPGFRLDAWLEERTTTQPVRHELGRNVNTPADWDAAQNLIHEELV